MTKTKDDENLSPEEILKSELEENINFGRCLMSRGRFLSAEGQKIVDRAKAMFGLVETSPYLINYENQIGYVRNMNTLYKTYLDEDDVNIKLVYSGGTISTASSSDISLGLPEPIESKTYVPSADYPLAQRALENWHEVHSTEKLKKEAIELLTKWGFDKGYPGEESPIKLCQIAFAAYGHPVNDADPVSSSLVPMRQCIIFLIDDLLKARPKHENYDKKEKIIAIGKQLKFDNLELQFFSDLNEKWTFIHTNLSNAKKDEMPRPLWTKYLNEAALFLISLLQGLDIDKVQKG
jgi:hypothetical protein